MANHIFKVFISQATSTISGSVKLSDAVNSSSKVADGIASTPYATKLAYDKATEAANNVTSLSSTVSTLSTSVSTNTTNLSTLQSQVDQLEEKSDKLHKVATTGSYNDLENTPTIYTQGELDTLLADKVSTSTILEDGIIKSSVLPSYVDDVIEVTTFNNLPSTGETGKIYICTDTNLQYRWTGTQYIEIPKSMELGTTDGTAYEGSAGAALENRVTTIESNVSDLTSTIEDLVGIDVTNNTVVILEGSNINVNAAKIFFKTINEDTTFTFDEPTNDYCEFTLFLENAGSYEVTLPDSTRWSHGFWPVFSVGTVDVLNFTTLDKGVNWFSRELDRDI